MGDRVKQLKLGHVFKIKNKSCTIYLRENFLKLDENTHWRETRSKAYNFQVSRVNTNTFAYSAIKDWNSLSNPIKGIVWGYFNFSASAKTNCWILELCIWLVRKLIGLPLLKRTPHQSKAEACYRQITCFYKKTYETRSVISFSA